MTPRLFLVVRYTATPGGDTHVDVFRSRPLTESGALPFGATLTDDSGGAFVVEVRDTPPDDIPPGD